MEGRRRVKEQLKRPGGLEFWNMATPLGVLTLGLALACGARRVLAQDLKPAEGKLSGGGTAWGIGVFGIGGPGQPFRDRG
jgi:hypothetical protein